VLHRLADPNGLAAWENALNHGMTRTDVAAAIQASPEGRAMQVADLYGRILHRVPDPAGQNAFVTFLTQGGTLMQAEANMMGSAEYFANRGGGTNASFLQAVYADVLNRAPDASGAATFGQQLSTGVSRADVVSAILTSLEARQYEVQGMYTRLLGRAPDSAGASAFSNAMQAGMSDAMVEASIIGSEEYKNHS
jgi:hypothetical protein